DAEGSARVNDLSSPDAGLGPIAYADRGALEYQPAGLPPVAVLGASPAVATAPASVTLDASGSSDPDGSIVSYTFDFGDGTTAGPQAAATATHVYGTGSWPARVTVTDNRGAASAPSAPLTVSVGPPNQPPAAALAVTPANGPAPLLVTANASG